MSLNKAQAEKRVDRYAFKRGSHAEKTKAFRLAGKIFVDSDFNAAQERKIRDALQRSRPVGYGFATRDEYGPDDSWSSQESLRGIHDRDHYIVGENHGFGARNF